MALVAAMSLQPGSASFTVLQLCSAACTATLLNAMTPITSVLDNVFINFP
jgi:hypothetical protein